MTPRAMSALPNTAGAQAGQPINTLRRDAEGLAATLPDLVLDAERLAASVNFGVHGRRRPGIGENFWEFRHYDSGDGLSRVDWRRSARADDLLVRERELETTQSVMFWRDNSAGMDYSSEPKKGLATKARRAAVLCAAAAILSSKAGEQVGVLGADHPARPGRMGLAGAMDGLARGADSELAFLDPALARGRGKFVLASDFLEPIEVWRTRINALSAAGAPIILLIVTDPAEELFPFAGRTQFLPLENGREPLLFGRAELARRAYQDRYAAHYGALRDSARRIGWPVVSSRTDRPASEALLALMAALAPQKR